MHRHIILVNRGWVPYQHKSPQSRLDGQIEGQVTLKGLIREEGMDRTSWTPENNVAGNYWFSIDSAEMAQVVGPECVHLVVDLSFGRCTSP